MQGFYQYYEGYITDHAIDADERRSIDGKENIRHFIDLDHYCQVPCHNFPEKWEDAVAMYSMDTLDRYGILPWVIYSEFKKLTVAFKTGNTDRILELSADLGHYIADAYVPLHTTRNYDGQYTRQKGIHALWESSIPEKMSHEFRFPDEPAIEIRDIYGLIWNSILSSYAEKDSVLIIENDISHTIPYVCKYTPEMGTVIPVIRYSDSYIMLYENKMHDMVARRMNGAIQALACLWTSAWTEAGRPNLNNCIGKAKDLPELIHYQ